MFVLGTPLRVYQSGSEKQVRLHHLVLHHYLRLQILQAWDCDRDSEGHTGLGSRLLLLGSLVEVEVVQKVGFLSLLLKEVFSELDLYELRAKLFHFVFLEFVEVIFEFKQTVQNILSESQAG